VFQQLTVQMKRMAQIHELDMLVARVARLERR
jgi:hypothetical protein